MVVFLELQVSIDQISYMLGKPGGGAYPLPPEDLPWKAIESDTIHDGHPQIGGRGR